MPREARFANVVGSALNAQLENNPGLLLELRDILCWIIKRNFDATPKITVSLDLNLGGVYEYPSVGKIRLPGEEEIPNVYVDPDEKVGITITTRINSQWWDLLNQGLALGCEWAVEIAENLP